MFGDPDSDAPKAVSPFCDIQGGGIALCHARAGEAWVAKVEAEAEKHRIKTNYAGALTASWNASKNVPLAARR